MAHLLPVPGADEWQFIEDVAGRHSHYGLDDLTPEVLHDIASSDGVDAATSLTFARVWDHPRSRPCIDALLQTIDDPDRIAGGDAALLVVPNGGYEVDPASQEMCGSLLSAARARGLVADVIATSSTSEIDENAATILATLAARQERHLIVISISIAGAQLRKPPSRPRARRGRDFPCIHSASTAVAVRHKTVCGCPQFS